MTGDPALRLLARLLPPAARGRYLEEWRADLAGASQVGLSGAGVLLGAIALVVRIDRDRPEHTGEPRGTLPRRLARRGAGLVVAACGVLAGLYLTGGNTPDPGAAPVVGAGFLVAARVLAVIAAVAAASGAILLVGAGFTARTWLARASLLAVVCGPALLVVSVRGAVEGPVLPLAGLLILLAGVAAGAVVLAGSGPLQLLPRSASRAQRLPVAAGGLALLVAVVVIGGIDVLVWNPLSKVPTLPLPAIYEGMVERDGFSIGANVGAVAVWAAFWLAAGIAVTAAAATRHMSALTPRRIAILLLALVSAAVFFRFFAGFGIGMSIADSFGVTGGDGSIASALLAFVGQLALAGAAVALGWAPRARMRRIEATAG
ncbi:hypothetical protein [uncultured Amnibacterium sp.]|uniref:hypothetical protein n=1 Tax=uncultured Amnibacterium sp. TaxID=1631851 RepID=UPI0035CB3353